MEKEKLLKKLGLEELIKTEFEDHIKIKELKKGESIFFEKLKEFTTYYIIKGWTQHIIYPPEGGEFYRNFYEQELAAYSFSFSKKLSPEYSRIFDVDMIIKEDSIIAYLPFEKILDINLDLLDKIKVMEKLLILGAKDHFKEFNYLLFKSLYTDEEFFLNYLQRCKKVRTEGLKKVSERLNINHRTLQRIVKNLKQENVIIKDKETQELIIKCEKNLEIYRNKKFKK